MSTSIKYAHVAIHPDIHRVLKQLVKDYELESIVAYLRWLFVNEEMFLKTAKKLKINPDAKPPVDIKCKDCSRVFPTAHGYNIHLNRGSTCKQPKINLVRRMLP